MSNKQVDVLDLDFEDLHKHEYYLWNFFLIISAPQNYYLKILNLDSVFATEPMPKNTFPYFTDGQDKDHLEQPITDDLSSMVNSFQVFWEYNECLKECLRSSQDLPKYTQVTRLEGYPIYVNDETFWKEYSQKHNIPEVLQSLSPYMAGFDMNSCYIRERNHRLETFKTAISFVIYIGFEFKDTLDYILYFLSQLDYDQQNKYPRTLRFLSNLEQQCKKYDCWEQFPFLTPLFMNIS